jgi:Nucleotidyl transferase AbiEii toxin, Type IV TA system
MMLQIRHQVSYDIDVFLSDLQLLGFLDPDLNSFNFEKEPTAFPGDGARFQRFVFKDLGEIDFFAAPPLTEMSSMETVIENQVVRLETIPEIIAKKIHFRGKSMQTRDLFDIAAAARTHSNEVRDALKAFQPMCGLRSPQRRR